MHRDAVQGKERPPVIPADTNGNTDGNLGILNKVSLTATEVCKALHQLMSMKAY